MKRVFIFISTILFLVFVLVGCGGNSDNSNSSTTATTNGNPPTASPYSNKLEEVERPQKIKDMMAARGEQEEAKPVLKIVEPANGATITNSTVNVKLALSGDLKGYKPMKEHDGTGNHIHVILDNQPYEAYYNIDQPFELRNVSDGEHTLRVFASRPWHESYKNDGSFQVVKFTVKQGGGDSSKPTTTGDGQKMSDNKNSNTAKEPLPKEGKEMKASNAKDVDAKKPLLTFSRPKGEYKGGDADAIMIDFWLTNAKLTGDGGEYRVRYSIDGGEAKFIDKWQPIWIKGFVNGNHSVRLELVDKDGKPIENGEYNSTAREFTVTK